MAVRSNKPQEKQTPVPAKPVAGGFQETSFLDDWMLSSKAGTITGMGIGAAAGSVIASEGGWLGVIIGVVTGIATGFLVGGAGDAACVSLEHHD